MCDFVHGHLAFGYQHARATRTALEAFDEHSGSIAEQSGGVPVPGNRGLSSREKESRINALFRPYHDTIGRLLDSRTRRPGLLLSIHSFTPVLNGRPRPWHIGVCHRRDRRFPNP